MKTTAIGQKAAARNFCVNGRLTAQKRKLAGCGDKVGFRPLVATPKNDMNQQFPLSGRCRCGNVRIRIDAPPLITMACHCTGCQKMSASAYSLSAAISSAAFAIIEGEPVIGGLRGHPRHYFCPLCMSWMFTRIDGREFVNLRPTMLDDSLWCKPFIESYTSEKLPWAFTSAVHSFEQFPPREAYADLIEEFAAQFSAT